MNEWTTDKGRYRAARAAKKMRTTYIKSNFWRCHFFSPAFREGSVCIMTTPTHRAGRWLTGAIVNSNIIRYPLTLTHSWVMASINPSSTAILYFDQIFVILSLPELFHKTTWAGWTFWWNYAVLGWPSTDWKRVVCPELRNVNSFTQSKILELNFTPRKARK